MKGGLKVSIHLRKKKKKKTSLASESIFVQFCQCAQRVNITHAKRSSWTALEHQITHPGRFRQVNYLDFFDSRELRSA